MKKTAVKLLVLSVLVFFVSQQISAQTTAFNYQGSLKDGGNPANGNYDFEFLLFDTASGGGQISSTVAVNNVAVTNGVFSVSLNFGNQFTGANRFLEIRVRPTGQSGFTILAPRQMMNSSPYSVKSLNAENSTNANNALSLGGVAANQYILTNDSRLSDARNPLPNSPNYIQNGFTPQQSSNFSISGTGEASAFRSNTVSADLYFLNGSPFLRSVSSFNVFVGIAVGNQSITGNWNSYFGTNTGRNTTTGSLNSFFGYESGNNNTTGTENSFFGSESGFSNTTANSNSFFGRSAGRTNTTGDKNSFFGWLAGFANQTGIKNSFFGSESGRANTTASNNSFFGVDSGKANTIGDRNSFFGGSSGLVNSTGTENAFFGYQSAPVNTTGAGNAFFGRDSGNANTVGSRNTFIGWFAGEFNVNGNDNTAIGASSEVFGDNLSFATAIGAGSRVSSSNTIALGRTDGSDFVRVFGLGNAGSISLCRNSRSEISTCSSSIRYKSNVSFYSSGLSLVKKLRPVSFNWKEGGMLDMGLVAEEVGEVEPLLVTRSSSGEIEGVKYDRVGVVLVNAINEQQAQIETQQKEIERQNTLIEQQAEKIKKQEDVLNKHKLELDALKQIVCSNNPDAVICQRKEEK